MIATKVIICAINLFLSLCVMYILSSCESPELPQPIKTPNYVRSYTVQPQQNGVTIFPKYIPILKLK